jgi:acyl-CoA reductase-like NAD-dependent aldehyde dehydrogenase
MIGRAMTTSSSSRNGWSNSSGSSSAPPTSPTSARLSRSDAATCAEGGTVAAGGGRLDRDGWFIEPTVFEDVRGDAFLSCEEVFGPVTALYRFGDLDEALARANAVRFGLSAWPRRDRVLYGRRHRLPRRVASRDAAAACAARRAAALAHADARPNVGGM